MTHFYCTGSCKATLSEIGICETNDCTHQWQMMQECDCSNGLHGVEELVITKDVNGAVLQNGDSVTLIKDLPLKRSSQVLKRGTKVTGIRLTSNPAEFDCKINGTAIVLRSEFVKKL